MKSDLMLKALNQVLSLRPECQAAWHSGRALKDWQSGVTIPIHKKRDSRKCTNYWGIFPLASMEKCMPSALKQDA